MPILLLTLTYIRKNTATNVINYITDRRNNKMKLSNLIPQDENIIIAIDGEVFQNNEGKYLVNVGYLRVACKDDTVKPSNIDIQREAIERYCHNAGITNLVLFVDDGYSGLTLERPGIQKFISMLNEQRNGMSEIRFSKFIIHRLDRLSRKLFGTMTFIDKYLIPTENSKAKNNYSDGDIDFISIFENIVFEKGTPQSLFMLHMFASLAELDRRLMLNKQSLVKFLPHDYRISD